MSHKQWQAAPVPFPKESSPAPTPLASLAASGVEIPSMQSSPDPEHSPGKLGSPVAEINPQASQRGDEGVVEEFKWWALHCFIFCF